MAYRTESWINCSIRLGRTRLPNTKGPARNSQCLNTTRQSLWSLARSGLVEPYVSPAILAEVHDVIGRPSIRTKFRQLTDDVVAEFIERIAIRVDEVGTGITLVRDPKDEPHLNLAAECQADYLVSRDRDLLKGADTIARTMPHLRIVEPAAFLIAVRRQIGNTF